MTEPIVADHRPPLSVMRADAEKLADSILAAIDAGVPQSTILPELITVLREKDLLPKGVKIPFIG